MFESTATMIIEKDKSASSITGESEEYEGFLTQSLGFGTHYKLITFTPVIERVIKSLHLDAGGFRKTAAGF